MTTDNRTNEPSHNRITIRAFRDGEVSIIHEDQVLGLACTLDELKRAVATYEARGALEAADRPAGTFTEAQVEAAAKAMHETRNPWFAAYGAWGAAGFEIKQAFRESARAALVAAQGAAPQAECDCGAGPGSAVCKKVCATRAPVLPSSGVDEEKLAEAWEAGCLAGGNRKHHTNMTEEQAEKAWPNPYRGGQVDSRG